MFCEQNRLCASLSICYLQDRYQAMYQHGSRICWILAVIFFSWNFVYLHMNIMKRKSRLNNLHSCLGFIWKVFHETGVKHGNSKKLRDIPHIYSGKPSLTKSVKEVLSLLLLHIVVVSLFLFIRNHNCHAPIANMLQTWFCWKFFDIQYLNVATYLSCRIILKIFQSLLSASFSY